MEIITINGVVLPSPSNIVISGGDIDSSGTIRNELGVLLRDRVRHNIYQIDLEFKHIEGHEVALIEGVIANKTLNVRFPDTVGFTTKKMYAVGPKKDLATYYDNNFDSNRWNLTFSLMEY